MLAMIAASRLLRGLVVGALLVALLAGCGGGGDATASQPLTRAQLIKRMEAICETEDAKKSRRIEKVGNPEKGFANSHREARRLVEEVVIPLYQELISEMASLQPPAKDKAQVRRVIGAYEATLRRAEANPEPLVLTDPFTKADIMARKYGVEGCTL